VFKQTSDKKIPLSGKAQKSKTEKFVLQLEKLNFKASSGWLDGFK